MGHLNTVASISQNGHDTRVQDASIRKGQTATLMFTPDQPGRKIELRGNGLDRMVIPITAAKLIIQPAMQGAGDAYELRTGQCLFLPCLSNEKGSFSEIEGHCLVVDIDPDVRRVLDKEQRRSSKSKISGPTICRRSTELLELVRSGRRYLNLGIDQFSAVVDSLGIMMLTELLISHKQHQTVPSNSLSDSSLEDIQSYIDEHLEQSIVLEQLANICSMSVYNFSKSFKAKTGSSPYKYVTNRRISKACELLCSTDNAIADVAYKVGFSSQSHMTELFRKTLGTTPARYRKQFSRIVISA